MRSGSLCRERGLSLVELLIAVAILATALTPLLAIFVHGVQTAEKGNKMTIANNLARELAEEIRSQSFWEPSLMNHPTAKQSYFPIEGGSAQRFGLDTDSSPININDGYATNKSRYATLDDVDDYHGWCRGDNCNCAGLPASQTILCQDNTPLENYDGTKLSYTGFTRRVEIFNIFPTPQNNRPTQHSINLVKKLDPTTPSNTVYVDAPFQFFDLRDASFAQLTTSGTGTAKIFATGRSRLKVIRVIVEYQGSATSAVKVEDVSLAVQPLSEE